MHILNFFWMLRHVIIYCIYPIEFGYLSLKPPILPFQTIQIVLNVGCVVIILSLHHLLS